MAIIIFDMKKSSKNRKKLELKNFCEYLKIHNTNNDKSITDRLFIMHDNHYLV